MFQTYRTYLTNLDAAPTINTFAKVDVKCTILSRFNASHGTSPCAIAAASTFVACDNWARTQNVWLAKLLALSARISAPEVLRRGSLNGVLWSCSNRPLEPECDGGPCIPARLCRHGNWSRSAVHRTQRFAQQSCPAPLGRYLRTSGQLTESGAHPLTFSEAGQIQK